MPDLPAWRRLPVGVEPTPHGGAHARVWAPDAQRVEVVLLDDAGATIGEPIPMEGEPAGYFSGTLEGVVAGTRYRFRLDGGDALPDPASRFQPDGPHGPSMVIDPSPFPWSDERWRGPRLDEVVLYELHIGTFTADGTFRAAIERLDQLVDVGVTAIEMMPVADFPGRFGWGYDGVSLFAPSRLYGTPDELRALVNAAHERGIAVILDVVYNHLGPDGNYLPRFAKRYFSDRRTEWGDALNFDGDDAGPVREHYLVGPRDTDEPSAWRTEIGWPVFRLAR